MHSMDLLYTYAHINTPHYKFSNDGLCYIACGPVQYTCYMQVYMYVYVCMCVCVCVCMCVCVDERQAQTDGKGEDYSVG